MAATNGVLGEGVVCVLERVIVRRLYERLGIQFAEKPGFGLADYAREVRAQFESRN